MAWKTIKDRHAEPELRLPLSRLPLAVRDEMRLAERVWISPNEKQLKCLMPDGRTKEITISSGLVVSQTSRFPDKTLWDHLQDG